MNKAIFYIVAALAFFVSTMFVIWQEKEKPWFSFMLKSLSSLLFAVLGVLSVFLNKTLTLGTVFLAIGLVVSVFGDVFLAQLEFDFHKKEKVISSGMTAFSLAQVFYVLGMALTVNFKLFYIALIIGFVLTVLVVLAEKPLKLKFGKLKPMVMVYSFLLSVALGQALMLCIANSFNLFSVLLLIAFVLFFVSDLLLSFIYFKQNSKRCLYYPNLMTYYVAQILIASAIMFF